MAAGVYRTAVEEFLRIVGKTFADEITPEDILLHQRKLRNRGCEPRTIANRHASVTAFLRFCKLDVKALATAKAKYEKTVPEIYATGILRVRSKPEFDFKIKDREERDLPIPADLLNRLKSYRNLHPIGRLV